MATAHSVRFSSSPSPKPAASRDSLDDPDEISPLLGTNSAHALANGSSHSGLWHSLSIFFDKNAGLSLVAASQFFFASMNMCVKWLNSLNEPVPMLEVRIGSMMVVFF